MSTAVVNYLIVVSVIYSCSAENSQSEGYFWRDYEGITPHDAYPAGLDSSGRNIYIGQVLHGNKLIPGKIYENDASIYFQYRQAALQADKNIKILCAQSPNVFEWYPTIPNDIPLITSKLIVKGGFEPNTFTYVGRIYTGGETSVGKVICLDTECLGLYIVKDGKAILFDKSLELLMVKTSGTIA